MPVDPNAPRYSDAFRRLLHIMNELREQCPWDRQQTFESLRPLTLEESYELSDAILSADADEIRKELGDLLLHIVFYARIASEQHDFDIADVIDSLCTKLVHRHPHVYGQNTTDDPEAVRQQWERLKLQEKAHQDQGILSGVPSGLPALIKAQRIQEKAHGIGFDFANKADVLLKLAEELTEFQQAKTPEEKEDEFGDLLFTLVNYARFIDLNAETALEKSSRKFMARFSAMETRIKADKKSLADLTTDEMNVYWQAVKQAGK